jgi:hypothetical protein
MGRIADNSSADLLRVVARGVVAKGLELFKPWHLDISRGRSIPRNEERRPTAVRFSVPQSLPGRD